MRELKDNQNKDFLKQTTEIKKKLDSYTTYHDQSHGHHSSREVPAANLTLEKEKEKNKSGTEVRNDRKTPTDNLLQPPKHHYKERAQSLDKAEKNSQAKDSQVKSSKGSSKDKTAAPTSDTESTKGQNAPVFFPSQLNSGGGAAGMNLQPSQPLQIAYAQPGQAIGAVISSQSYNQPMMQGYVQTLQPFVNLGQPILQLSPQIIQSSAQQNQMPQITTYTQQAYGGTSAVPLQQYNITTQSQPQTSAFYSPIQPQQSPGLIYPYQSQSQYIPPTQSPQQIPFPQNQTDIASPRQPHPQSQQLLSNQAVSPQTPPHQNSSYHQQTQGGGFPPPQQYNISQTPGTNIFKDSIVDDHAANLYMNPNSSSISQQAFLDSNKYSNNPYAAIVQGLPISAAAVGLQTLTSRNNTKGETLTFAAPKSNYSQLEGSNGVSQNYNYGGQSPINPSGRISNLTQLNPQLKGYYPLSPEASAGQENFRPLTNTQSGPTLQGSAFYPAKNSPQGRSPSEGRQPLSLRTPVALYSGMQGPGGFNTDAKLSFSALQQQSGQAYDVLLNKRQQTLSNHPNNEGRFPKMQSKTIAYFDLEDDKFDHDTKGDDIKIDN